MKVSKSFWRLAAAILLAGGACDSMSPNQPDQGLVIHPDTASLRVSETAQFSATLDGTAVTPTWSSSAPSLVSVTDSGMAIGVATGTAVITASTNNVSASRNIQVVSDYRGQYSGTLIITRCVRLSGGGPASSCVVGALFSINALRIDQQSGTSVSGALNVFAEPTIGSVSGAITDNDHITSMTGTLRSNGEDSIGVVIQRWDTALVDGGRQLTGSFGVDMQFQNGFGPQHQNIDFSLSNVFRQ